MRGSSVKGFQFETNIDLAIKVLYVTRVIHNDKTIQIRSNKYMQ